MDKLKVVDAAWHGMKGAWGMAKDQLTGDSADDNYDPKKSPLQAFRAIATATRSDACAGTSAASAACADASSSGAFVSAGAAATGPAASTAAGAPAAPRRRVMVKLKQQRKRLVGQGERLERLGGRARPGSNGSIGAGRARAKAFLGIV